MTNARQTTAHRASARDVHARATSTPRAMRRRVVSSLVSRLAVTIRDRIPTQTRVIDTARDPRATARGDAFARFLATNRTRRASTSDETKDKKTNDRGARARARTVAMTPEIRRLLDMRDPSAWYPLARSMRREITLHVGPTNSGKTHAAMERLKTAASGTYCAPLRLLAWEISESMNGEGVPCALVTGQERREAPNARHASCTVEMSDLSKVMDCAVIDEIQLLSDPHRGYAYTRALLGLPALELHLCGDPRAVPLVRRVVKSTGDLLVVKEYERLSLIHI